MTKVADSACTSSASAERVGQGEVGGVTCKWWLAVKAPWLGLGGLILALAAWTGLVNTTLTLWGSFLAGNVTWALNVFT